MIRLERRDINLIKQTIVDEIKRFGRPMNHEEIYVSLEQYNLELPSRETVKRYIKDLIFEDKIFRVYSKKSKPFFSHELPDRNTKDYRAPLNYIEIIFKILNKTKGYHSLEEICVLINEEWGFLPQVATIRTCCYKLKSKGKVFTFRSKNYPSRSLFSVNEKADYKFCADNSFVVW